MADWVAIIVAIALLLGNAFFVGAEFALVSARRTQIEPAAQSGSRSARLTLRAMDRVSLMMAGAQLGITMCSLGLGAIGEPAVAHLVEPGLGLLGIPESLLHPIAFVIAMTIVVYLHMVLGEMVPKNIAIAGPERSARLLGPLLLGVVTLLLPLIALLNLVANLVLRLIRVTPREDVASVFTEDQVAAFIAESRAEGLLDEEEHGLLHGAITIGSEDLRSVMVPLDDLLVLEPGASVAEVEQASVRSGFSRFPVGDPPGGLAGYVHLKDLLGIKADAASQSIPREHIRPLVQVEADTSLDEALGAMQARGAHMATVTVAGEIVGAAMLEDVVERLVGEVSDTDQDTRSPSS